MSGIHTAHRGWIIEGFPSSPPKPTDWRATNWDDDTVLTAATLELLQAKIDAQQEQSS